MLNPIQTAPRDGTKIRILDTRDNSEYEAFWYVDTVNVMNLDRTVLGVWLLSKGGWFDSTEEKFLTWKVE